MSDQAPDDPQRTELENTLRKIENHVAHNEFHYRGQTVIESDSVLHFIALVRQAAKAPSS